MSAIPWDKLHSGITHFPIALFVFSMFLDLFDTFVHAIEEELVQKSTHAQGRAHGGSNTQRYNSRIDAMNYAMEHDDLPPPGSGKTIADSIDVHVPRNWRRAVRAIREAEGVLVSASDDAILDAMR